MLVVDYGREVDLMFSLAGVDVVVSMISGPEQISLMDAAFRASVRRFIPSEFEGPPGQLPIADALDRGQNMVLARLRQYEAHGMEYTVFSCGILYEGFSPGGLDSSNIGKGLIANKEGDYLLHMRHVKAHIPYDPSGRPAVICMTSAQNTGRFVVNALDLPILPSELRMRDERLSVSEIVDIAEQVRGELQPLLSF